MFTRDINSVDGSSCRKAFVDLLWRLKVLRIKTVAGTKASGTNFNIDGSSDHSRITFASMDDTMRFFHVGYPNCWCDFVEFYIMLKAGIIDTDDEATKILSGIKHGPWTITTNVFEKTNGVLKPITGSDLTTVPFVTDLIIQCDVVMPKEEHAEIESAISAYWHDNSDGNSPGDDCGKPNEIDLLENCDDYVI